MSCISSYLTVSTCLLSDCDRGRGPDERRGEGGRGEAKALGERGPIPPCSQLDAYRFPDPYPTPVDSLSRYAACGAWYALGPAIETLKAGPLIDILAHTERP